MLVPHVASVWCWEKEIYLVKNKMKSNSDKQGVNRASLCLCVVLGSWLVPLTQVFCLQLDKHTHSVKLQKPHVAGNDQIQEKKLLTHRWIQTRDGSKVLLQCELNTQHTAVYCVQVHAGPAESVRISQKLTEPQLKLPQLIKCVAS